MLTLINAYGSNYFTQTFVRLMLSPLHTRSNTSPISLARYSIMSSFLRGEEQKGEMEGDVSDVTAYIQSQNPFYLPKH